MNKCPVCGKAAVRKYCGWACYTAVVKKSREGWDRSCQVCGQPFEKWRSPAYYFKRKFCSKACAGANKTAVSLAKKIVS